MIGLSGLITPSLDEMVHVAAEMEREGFDVPLLIGGATTSRVHTAVKIHPNYDARPGGLCHRREPRRRRRVSRCSRRTSAGGMSRGAQANMRSSPTRIAAPKPTSSACRSTRARDNALQDRLGALRAAEADVFRHACFRTYDVAELVPYIDWTPFFQTWELKGRFPAILEDEKQGAAARQLYDDAQAMLKRIIEETLVQPEGGDRLLAGECGRRRHPAVHRRDAQRRARDVLHAAPAAAEARRAGRMSRSPISSLR